MIRPLSLAGGALLAAMPLAAAQANFVITDLIHFIDARGFNTAGLVPGTRISLGINVTPVGTQPVPSADGTTITASQGGFSFPVNYIFSVASPTQFFTSIDYETYPTLTGAWSLSLTNPTVNGGAPTIATLPALTITTPPPFIRSILLTPDAADRTRPTITWDRGGYTPDRQTVTIYNRDQVTPTGGSTAISVSFLSGTANSFTIPVGLLNSSDHYTFSVTMDRRSGTRVLARSRTFVDFTAIPSDAVFLAVTGVDNDLSDDLGAPFIFDIPVVAGTMVHIDPEVATGYEYRLGDGDPLFSSVVLPEIGDADGYFLCLWNGASYDACTTQLDAGETYVFVGGTTRFRVIGIDPDLGLEPSNPAAFATGLTFDATGRFTGTQTPIVTEVPEPASLALLTVGLIGIAARRRR